nr:MAG TPA: hypothetical protein [Caudoviricetes sp.]
MEAKTIHNSNISFIEVLAALVEFFTLCALFLIQGIIKAARMAGRFARIAWRWLNTRHLFGDDSEAVTLTGWQYLGVGAIALSFFLLLAIKI